MSKTKDNLIDLNNQYLDQINIYLKNSNNFDEFFVCAEKDIFRHLTEIRGEDTILEDVIDYAQDVWSDYCFANC